jgi:hypothetical protein
LTQLSSATAAESALSASVVSSCLGAEILNASSLSKKTLPTVTPAILSLTHNHIEKLLVSISQHKLLHGNSHKDAIDESLVISASMTFLNYDVHVTDVT